MNTCPRCHILFSDSQKACFSCGWLFQQSGYVPSALNDQVGGDHYRNMAIQPAEYTTKNGIGHLAGDAIAYISRYRSKNGRQDLEKAIHSIRLLIELEYGAE